MQWGQKACSRPFGGSFLLLRSNFAPQCGHSKFQRCHSAMPAICARILLLTTLREDCCWHRDQCRADCCTRQMQHSTGQYDDLARVPRARPREGCRRRTTASRHRRHSPPRCSCRVVPPIRDARLVDLNLAVFMCNSARRQDIMAQTPLLFWIMDGSSRGCGWRLHKNIAQ